MDVPTSAPGLAWTCPHLRRDLGRSASCGFGECLEYHMQHPVGSVFIAELTTTPAAIFRYKPKLRTNKPYLNALNGSEWHRARMTAPEFSSAENFANFCQLSVFHARLLSEHQCQYSTTRVVANESPHAIYTRWVTRCLSAAPSAPEYPGLA